MKSRIRPKTGPKTSPVVKVRGNQRAQNVSQSRNRGAMATMVPL